MKRGLAVAVLVAALLPPAAGAHFGTGKKGYRSIITGLRPVVRGLELKVLYGDDQVFLDNRSGETIVIKGYSGEPFLRFGPGGVYVNGRSPSVYLNNDRYARSPVPKFANAKARPEWQKLAGGEIWAWHDHRIHWMSPIAPQMIRAAPRKRHHIFDWSVPATANGKKFLIKGALNYVPPPKQSFPVGLALTLGSLIGVGLIGLFALRRVILRSME